MLGMLVQMANLDSQGEIPRLNDWYSSMAAKIQQLTCAACINKMLVCSIPLICRLPNLELSQSFPLRG